MPVEIKPLEKRKGSGSKLLGAGIGFLSGGPVGAAAGMMQDTPFTRALGAYNMGKSIGEKFGSTEAIGQRGAMGEANLGLDTDLGGGAMERRLASYSDNLSPYKPQLSNPGFGSSSFAPRKPRLF